LSERGVAYGDAEDGALAVAAAQAAARELISLREDLSDEVDLTELRKRADQQSHQVLVRVLLGARPGDAILSEEGADDPSRVGCDRVWIIDPLDGTREFGELGRTDWAVHVALVKEGRLALGVVALPALGLTLTSMNPPRLPARTGPLRVVVSRTRPPALADQVTRRLSAVQVPMGSAGAKAMSILLGWADVYVHAGGQHEWDSAAPVAVARAARLHASRIDGSPLLYNQDPAWLPDLLICRPELADKALHAVRESS
jgi:3'(2'), 5'-bisphosphate nucleotidase